MPLAMAQRIIDEAAKLGCTAIAIDGGEATLHRDVAEIVRYCSDASVVPILMTNGLMLPSQWQRLGEAGARFVIVSIDSLDWNNYQQQRGVRLSRALAGLDAAEQLRDTYPEVVLLVTAVLTRHNTDEIVPMLSQLSSRGIGLQISPVHSPRGPNDELENVTQTRIRSLVDELIRLKGDGYLVANSRGFLQHLPEFFKNGRSLPPGHVCVAGYTHVFVDTSGDVRPCYDYNFGVVGNLKRRDLGQVWSSDRMKTTRIEMAQGECVGCWLLCTAEVSMLMSDQM